MNEVMLFVGLALIWLGGIITGYGIALYVIKIRIQTVLDKRAPKVRVSDLYPKRDHKDESNE